tara:strand:+ start:372 stop:818 length:447 start_codon:yes stop_codon:yes gene_type:complete
MKKEKTMHELAKEFPNKTYRELEKYREEDRQQEAGTCIIGEARKDREKPTEPEFLIETYEKEIWKLKQLLSKALQDTNTLEGTKRIVIELSKEKIILKKRAQEALVVNESHQKLNGKLQERVTELEEDNKKLSHQIEDRINKMRRSGM